MRYFACMRVCVKAKNKKKKHEKTKPTVWQSAKFSFLVCCLFPKTKEITNEQGKQQEETCNLQLAACKENNAQYKWISHKKKKKNNKYRKNNNRNKNKTKKLWKHINKKPTCNFSARNMSSKGQRGNVKLQREPPHLVAWLHRHHHFAPSITLASLLTLSTLLACHVVVIFALFVVFFCFFFLLGVFLSHAATKCNFSTLICSACAILYCRVFREFHRYSFFCYEQFLLSLAFNFYCYPSNLFHVCACVCVYVCVCAFAFSSYILVKAQNFHRRLQFLQEFRFAAKVQK